MTNLHHWLCVILLQMGAIIYSYYLFQSSKEERNMEKWEEIKLRVYSTPWSLTIAKHLEKFKKGANESHGLAEYRWARANNMYNWKWIVSCLQKKKKKMDSLLGFWTDNSLAQKFIKLKLDTWQKLDLNSKI